MMPAPWTADSSAITADSAPYTADGGFYTPPPPPVFGSPNLAVPQPLLSATLPAYPYKQYADDDDIQAFFAAYNAATQTFVDWFNSINLPFYPALAGDLLDWVAQGRYGFPRTSLAQSTSGALGPLNTEDLNTATLNSFTPPSTTYYTLTDDVFKRILTWNLYKGDGKRFNMMWLKRRIMRFLLGANGLDPNPAGSVIGTENTQAIGVQVVSGALTVSITQPYLASVVQLTPGILDLFVAAFTGGILELPLQYTYAVNIVTDLVATAAPTSESVTGIATTLSTGTADISVYGGSGAYTFAWTWQSGGTGIGIDAASAQSTTFTATSMTRGTTLTGIALCTVTDTSTSQTATATVAVTIKNVSVPSVSLSTSSLSTTSASASQITSSVTATISGGAGPYVTAWTWQSGGTGITINEPSAVTTSCSASSLSPGVTDSGTLLCTVTDAYGQPATATCTVSMHRVTLLSASVSPPSLSVSSSSVPMTTGAATVTASGGQTPYSYAWTFTWTSHTDSASYAIGSPHSASTTLTASGMSAGNTDTGTAKCVVTDAYGQTANVSVGVSFTYLPPLLRTFTAATTDTVPAGYTTAAVEGWAPGGGGGGGDGTLGDAGGGGGAGGYFRSQFSVTGGQTFTINEIGSGGAAGPSGNPGGNGTSPTKVTAPSSAVMVANPGSGGPSYPTASGGAGGTATGGNQANTTGGSGGGAGNAGVPANGVYFNNPATYGKGGTGAVKNVGSVGASGVVSIRYS